MPKMYRIVCKHRHWIGKPDPSKMGDFTVESDDPAWLNQHAHSLARKGDKIYKTQKWTEGGWKTI